MIIKYIVLGGFSVGKTTIINNFKDKFVLSPPSTTFFEFSNINTIIQKEIVNQNILDTVPINFNYNLLKHDKNVITSAFLHMIFEKNFQPCILGPTRIVDGKNPSLLDNIFSKFCIGK